MSDLIFHAGAECYDLYGALSKHTSLEEDVAETFARTGGNAYYVDRNGVLRIAEANALSTEWTGSDFSTPNMIIDGARTNGWTRSEELGDAAWSAVRASVSADDTTAPDGTTTADKIVEDSTASSDHRIGRNTPTLTDDTDQPPAFFAKAAERTEVRAHLVGKDNTTRSVWFDLSAGTVGTASNALGRITALADSWYRCELVADGNNGGTTPTVAIRLGSGSETSVYNGDGASGVHMWGIQFEPDQPFAGSYIQTVGSTVTRNAEACSFPFHTSPREMTVYARFIERGSILSANLTRIFHIGSATGTADPRFYINVDGPNDFYEVVHDNGTTTANAALAVTPSIGDTVELRAILAADGSVTIGQSVNAATETTASNATVVTLGSAWAGPLLHVGCVGTSNVGFAGFLSVKVARGTKTMAEMRALGV